MPRPKRKASALIIHPLVPVAKAAKVLRIAPELLIEKLNEGEILGENRPLDSRKPDKKGHKKGEPESQNGSWFIYASEFNRLLDERLAQYEKPISTDGLDQFFTDPEYRLDSKFSPTFPGTTVDQAKTTVTGAELPTEIAAPTQTIPSAGPEADKAAESTIEPACAAEEDLQQEITLIEVYDSPDQNISAAATLDGATVVAELVQHLRDEIAYRHTLECRIDELASEIAYLRSEIMQRPAAEASPLKRLGNYLRLFLRDVKALCQ